MKDLIIVGAGPAGLTAAIYAARAEKKVLVLEAFSYGGQIINTPEIENYPAAAHISGFDFATKLYEQAKESGAEIIFEKAVEIIDGGKDKTVVTPKNRYTAGAVILATGSKNRKLGLDREDQLIGKGISYCATCDGAFYRGKRVAVVGGGNTALEDALYLSNLADSVTLIHRRDAFRAESGTVSRLKQKPNVHFLYHSTVTALLGDKRLTGVEVTDKDGQTQILETDGLFVAIGRIPENQNFAPLLTLDEAGYAASDETCATKTPGIYVAGDARSKQVRQLVTAAADGAVAATEAVKYIESLTYC